MNSPSESPTQHTLNTPELLELILSQLDPRTLLTVAQLTCRTWRTLIQTSHPLQEALFFRPARASPTTAAPESKKFNPLLAWAFPGFFPQRPGCSSSSGEAPSARHGAFHWHTLDFVARPDKRPAYFRKEASWRRMLVQQQQQHPPLQSVGLMTACSGMSGEEVCLESWNSPQTENALEDGLRMETLFELLFFNELLRYSWYVGVVWRDERRAPEHVFEEYQGRLGKPEVQEVVVCVFASVGCEESDDEDEESEVRAVQGVVVGGYNKEGLRTAPFTGGEGGWAKGEVVQASGWWD
ncbi:hypothetical protein ASPACDRAFT_47320 [Aspergillus aculeatus ATCC 16872]|uniref:F-box domain-containing protein n=1 Tax=Aspergillus aculeatus (strain ATCC 16872 / CBS 172.66 / WB 5094) TaxID=690307 RepID=A0A1L9WIH9_ASPA1|nr:uncharacterized protein ASPACDRAFT_47320 [Aspergillus aculeatus ATCC 16872]OJJ95963.1 hypothetical protein ASPACDRAFT_47320 [Aspergillus aculeatus ATCC 16872]